MDQMHGKKTTLQKEGHWVYLLQKKNKKNANVSLKTKHILFSNETITKTLTNTQSNMELNTNRKAA